MSSSWPPGPHRGAFAHAIVNGVGVASVTALHLWGHLEAHVAAGAILLLCGIWVSVTRKGPPSGPPGLSGAVFLFLSSLRHHGPY